MSTVINDIHGNPAEYHWCDGLQQLKQWMWGSMVACAALLSDMSFFDHLEELRKRLIKCAIAIGAGFLVCLTYNAQLVRWLGKPAQLAGVKLVAIDATEIFSIYFKVATAGAICLASPVILWQIWRFIEPALHKHEKRWAAPFLLSTIFCFVLGAFLGFRLAAPWLLRLETTWAKAVDIGYTPTAMSYFGLLTATVVVMGAVFEMPPIVAILSRIGLINARFLWRHSSHAVIIFGIASAAATPGGDLPPTIALMSVMLVIYAVCIVLAWIFGKPREVEA